MKTIKYYSKGKYLGWEKLTTYQLQYLKLRSWILSGNDIVVNDKLINDVDYIKELY